MANELTDELTERLSYEAARRIRDIAEEYDFSYEEALNYVITVGLAYARRPPLIAQEPGA